MSGSLAGEVHQKKSNGAARIGIGGPVGSGKTALIEQLIPAFCSKSYRGCGRYKRSSN